MNLAEFEMGWRQYQKAFTEHKPSEGAIFFALAMQKVIDSNNFVLEKDKRIIIGSFLFRLPTQILNFNFNDYVLKLEKLMMGERGDCSEELLEELARFGIGTYYDNLKNKLSEKSKEFFKSVIYPLHFKMRSIAISNKVVDLLVA